ncbi:hypothetical protein [Lactococcus garvieae]
MNRLSFFFFQIFLLVPNPYLITELCEIHEMFLNSIVDIAFATPINLLNTIQTNPHG